MPGSATRATVSPVLLTLLILLPSTAPLPASAQYMFLDANGDGVNSAADVLNPIGTTTLEVWLRTNSNRDGSAAVCASGEELTINSYEFILEATNGTMNWHSFTNLQPTMLTSFGLGSNGTDYHNGFGGGTILPPGDYHLGTLEVSVALGTPSLSIVPSTSLSGAFLTSFGSQCLAQEMDNTMRLGADWFDVDGVPYGGNPQAPPVLAPIADMTVNEGATVVQTITATDADLQPLEFTKLSGPTFMTVATTATGSGTGTAQATITLTPGPTDQGSSSGTVRVSDGIASDQKSFAITVVGFNTSPPIIAAHETITALPGTDIHDGAAVRDPDGDAVTLSMVQRPSFVLPYLFGAEESGPVVNGVYYGRPSVGDVGTSLVIFEATDGSLTAHARTAITVSGTSPSPAPRPDLFGSLYTVTELAGPSTAIGMGDFDGDGDADAAIASAAAGIVAIYASDRRGGLDLIENIPATSPRAIAVGDLNRDGSPDVVYVDDRTDQVVVLRGPFHGATSVFQTIHVGSRPVSLALGDLDHDGWLDAAVALRGGDAVAVLANDGTGSLEAPTNLSTSPDPMAVALGDYNGDSWLDLAVVCRSTNRLNTFLSSSGSGFMPVVSSALPSFGPAAPTAAASLSFGTDAYVDLLVGDELRGVQILTSRGDGTFGGGAIYFGSSTALALGDLGGSGRMGFVTGVSSNPNSFPYDAARRYVGVYAPGTSTALNHNTQPGGPITGIAVGDVDANGTQDVISVQDWTMSGIAAVWRNQGDGRLGSAVVTPAGYSRARPALADFDDDGHLDLVLGSQTYLGRGDGTFNPQINTPVPSSEGECKAADLNGDGRQDLVFMDGCCYDIHLYLGDGAGNFAPGPEPVIRSLMDQARLFALADMNEDGIVDLVIGNGTYAPPEPHRFEFWPGRGDGTFAPPTLLTHCFIRDLDVLDYDSDGHLDITYVDSDGTWALRGHGDGTFDEPAALILEIAEQVNFGDLNGDGRLDMTFSSDVLGFPLRMAFQQPDHSFVPTRPSWTLGGYAYMGHGSNPPFDADGDGDMDILSGFDFGLALGLGSGGANVGRRRVFGPPGVSNFIADMNEDGWPDIVLAGGNFYSNYNPIVVILNNSDLLHRRAARVFQIGASKTIPVGVTGRDVCLRVEPVGGSYENTDLDLTSIVMKSVGTGSVNQIVAIPAKKLVLGDSDGNGVPEIDACFASADLGRLFSEIQGRREVPVVLEGRVAGGGRMHGELILTVVHTGPSAAPTLSPNPLNPAGVFRFVTSRPGLARIQIFDVQGRLVRTVVDRALPAGAQEVVFDGKDGVGRSLASGIYFARIETTEGEYRMRVAIVK